MFWKTLDAHGKVDQEKVSVVFYCDTGNQFAYTANIDEWLELWQSINGQVEECRKMGAGTIFVRLRADSTFTVTWTPLILAELRLQDQTDNVQPS